MSRGNSLVSECLDVVQQTPAADLSVARGLPQQARGVDHVAEDDGRGDVAEDAEDDELDAQRERLLLLLDGSES